MHIYTRSLSFVRSAERQCELHFTCPLYGVSWTCPVRMMDLSQVNGEILTK